MVDNVLICNKVKRLMEYYNELKSFSNLSLDEYKSNIIVKRAIERQIQLVVECTTDINNMILKRIAEAPPKDYFNSFIDLAEHNVLSMDYALEIAPSTGLRNIIVHQYEQINDEIVYASIDKIFKYYKQYIDIISKYLGCE